MAVAVSCTQFRRVGGKAYVRWDDGTELEFSSIEQARDWVRGILVDQEQIRELLRALAMAKLLTSSPDGSSGAALVGRTITLDLNLPANIVRIT